MREYDCGFLPVVDSDLVSIDVYRLRRDRETVYTCACFTTPAAMLEDTQIAKMDLVCRKLHLRATLRAEVLHAASSGTVTRNVWCDDGPPR